MPLSAFAGLRAFGRHRQPAPSAKGGGAVRRAASRSPTYPPSDAKPTPCPCVVARFTQPVRAPDPPAYGVVPARPARRLKPLAGEAATPVRLRPARPAPSLTSRPTKAAPSVPPQQTAYCRQRLKTLTPTALQFFPMDFL